MVDIVEIWDKESHNQAGKLSSRISHAIAHVHVEDVGDERDMRLLSASRLTHVAHIHPIP